MKKVLLDTSFLIDLVRFRVGMDEIPALLQEPHKIFSLSATLNELRKIARKGGTDSNLARLALEIVKLKKVKTIWVKEKNADRALLSLADKNTIVATDDRELRKRLKSLGIKTIYVRAKKHLATG
jgi:hypothetical protein